MNNSGADNEITLEGMKRAIADAGGVFCQYRACKRNAATIYDIENIRRGVVYAQTPLNMNDPFDSMVGFSADKIYENCVQMLVDALNVDTYQKAILCVFLRYKNIGKIAELLLFIKEIKRYTITRRASMHKSNIPLQRFILENATVLYSKCPKNVKSVFEYTPFVAFALLVCDTDTENLSEEGLVTLIKMGEQLEQLHLLAEEIRDKTYKSAIREFLAKLTVTCFTASGWKNQLMWSHYANSYSGICIEYDFNKIEEPIGFIYPVKYTAERPTLSLPDLGMIAIDLQTEDKIVRGEPSISAVINYLLCKNDCWKYEDEWRIINIGEPDTPRFVELPYIKSITFGLNVDPLCRRLLLDVCAERNIPCFEISLSSESFNIDRLPIETSGDYDLDQEVEYINLLCTQTNDLGEKLKRDSDILSPSLENGPVDEPLLVAFFQNTVDFLCNAYFIKISLNRIGVNHAEELESEGVPTGMENIISEVNAVVKAAKELKFVALALSTKGLIKRRTYQELRLQTDNIFSLIDKIEGNTWHNSLSVKENADDVAE